MVCLKQYVVYLLKHCFSDLSASNVTGKSNSGSEKETEVYAVESL